MKDTNYSGKNLEWLESQKLDYQISLFQDYKEIMKIVANNLMESSIEGKCDLVTSTGVHDGSGVIKQLLAGAHAVQVASTLYKNGPEQVGVMLNELEKWMDHKGYSSLDDFRGKLSYKNVKDPALYERVQFMKYFGSHK